MFQSTPPRGRRRSYTSYALALCTVSIHASAWEATYNRWRGEAISEVSIHASAWEATRYGPQPWPPLAGFNPRLRVGGDAVIGSKAFVFAIGFNPRLRVGGDGRRETSGLLEKCFNPRLRVGGDTPQGPPKNPRRVSIHASAWEATRAVFPMPGRAASFNPRLRVGGDSTSGQRPCPQGRKFQSTPPRGRRLLRQP